MADNTEYIFKKDAWGNWKLVPKTPDSGGGFVILLLFAAVLFIIFLVTSPLWISLLGFKMVKNKRYYAGIGALIGVVYTIIDFKNNWLTGFLVMGYMNKDGIFQEGLFGNWLKIFIVVSNFIGFIIGLVFIIDSIAVNIMSKHDENPNSIEESEANNITTGDTKSLVSKKVKSNNFIFYLIIITLSLVTSFLLIKDYLKTEDFGFKDKESYNIVDTIAPEAIMAPDTTGNFRNQESNNLESIENDSLKTSESANYEVINEYLIKDLKTNYYWLIGPDSAFNSIGAEEVVQKANTENAIWRIPTFDEVISLYNTDYSAGTGFYFKGNNYPAKINSAFNRIGSGSWFWLSDAHSDSSKAYAINLYEGIKVEFQKRNPEIPVHILLISN